MAYDKLIMARARHIPCICCGTTPSEYHHLKTIKAGGTDDVWNLMPLCRQTHSMIHQHGLNYVAIKCDVIERWLIENGWERCSFRNKWIRKHVNHFV